MATETHKGRMLAHNEQVGPQQPLISACECNQGIGKTLPVWKQTQTCDAVRRQLDGLINPDLPFLTYRCPTCKRKTVFTLGQVFDL